MILPTTVPSTSPDVSVRYVIRHSLASSLALARHPLPPECGRGLCSGRSAARFYTFPSNGLQFKAPTMVIRRLQVNIGEVRQRAWARSSRSCLSDGSSSEVDVQIGQPVDKLTAALGPAALGPVALGPAALGPVAPIR